MYPHCKMSFTVQDASFKQSVSFALVTVLLLYNVVSTLVDTTTDNKQGVPQVDNNETSSTRRLIFSIGYYLQKMTMVYVGTFASLSICLVVFMILKMLVLNVLKIDSRTLSNMLSNKAGSLEALEDMQKNKGKELSFKDVFDVVFSALTNESGQLFFAKLVAGSVFVTVLFAMFAAPSVSNSHPDPFKQSQIDKVYNIILLLQIAFSYCLYFYHR